MGLPSFSYFTFSQAEPKTGIRFAKQGIKGFHNFTKKENYLLSDKRLPYKTNVE
jgi:hypothetical protein